MQVLRAGVEDALSGRGRLLLLTGEAGIGKTRTAEEIATYARERGAQVLWGRCVEEEGAPAFWPWVQVLRRAIRALDVDSLPVALGLSGPDIAAIVPELGQRLDDLLPAAGLESPQTRFRCFDSIAGFLGRLSRRTPLVIILDDLHGADEPSLRLLQFVVRELRDVSVLLIGTFRDIVLTGEHALNQTFAEVLREPSTQRLALAGLGEPEVRHFIELTAGVPPAAGLVAELHECTAGNPLFLTEFVRVLVAEGVLNGRASVDRVPVGIPEGVRAIIGRHLAPLPRECRVALSAACVMGREFRADVLAAVIGAEPTALLNALRQAEGAHVFMEIPGALPRYRFAHALIRETLYQELGAGRRAALHRKVGERIEQLPNADDYLAELAHHFCEAGRGGPRPIPSNRDNEKAVTYAQRAGDRALALLAYEEAVRLYDVGLAVLDHCGAGPHHVATEQRRYELLMARGLAQKRTDIVGAKLTFKQAVEAARKVGAAESLGRAVLGVADWLPLGQVDTCLVEMLEEAITALGQDDSATRARLLGRLAIELCECDARDRRATLARQAVAIARRVGEPEALVHALFALHAADCGPENAHERLAGATEMIRVAARLGDSELIVHGQMWRIVDLFELGDGPALDREIGTFTQLAEALRQPRYLCWAAHFRAVRAMSQGRFEEAEHLAMEMMTLAQRGQEDSLGADSLFGCEMFALRSMQGRLGEFEAAMRARLELPGHGSGVRCGLASLYAELGRTAEARIEFECLAISQFATLPRDAFWLNGIACLARACTFLGDVERAGLLYGLLRPYDGRAVAMGHPATFYDGPVAHYLGLLAATLSRWEVASRHFEDSLRMNRRMRARPQLAYTQYAYAAMLVRWSASEGACAPENSQMAADLGDQALATAQELGMHGLAEKVQGLKSRIQLSARDRRETALLLRPPANREGEGAVAPGDQPPNVRNAAFHKDGDYWTVEYDGVVSRFRDSKGLQWIAELLRHPGCEFLALDLASTVAGTSETPALEGARARFAGTSHDAGPLLDAKATAAYKRRVQDLREELEEAERFNDLGRATHAREEIEILSQHLARAVGLRGANRLGPSEAERARQTVTKGIKSAVAKISASNPALARHLTRTIATGYFCTHRADPDRPIEWSF